MYEDNYSPSIFPGAPDEQAFAPARHEDLLRSNPARYAELVRNISSYGVYMIDLEGRILSWNQGARLITGYTEGEVLGRPFTLLFCDDALRDDQPGKSLNFARSSGHSRTVQKRRKRNGDEIFAEVTMDAVRAENGEISGFVEVCHDITEQKQREDRLYQRATRDPLTGVFNRGHFAEVAMQEIDRARRFSEPLSLVMMDIDHFKKVNDTYGHEAGDKAIISLAATTGSAIRKIDALGRIGGEEFALLLPRANKDPAFETAQRLRIRLMEQRIDLGGGQSLNYTVSMGVAALRPTTRDLQELMRNADAALYKAKREGRNRVEAWFE
ncbi:MAG: diguanylate cyclase [Nevskiaceae bacterium]|nr:MAG: diguanylate cyclase [Nevskiaceae bacterium]